MYNCESCWTRKGQPTLFDDNVECYLCGKCRKALKAAGHTVTVMDLTR